MKNNLLLSILGFFVLAEPVYSQQDVASDAMKMMADAQNCMMQLDFQELESMEEKSKMLESDILSLCAAGNEAEAKAVALKFSDEVMNSKTMLGMKKCFEGIPGMEEQLNVPDFREELEQKSICEVVKNK